MTIRTGFRAALRSAAMGIVLLAAPAMAQEETPEAVQADAAVAGGAVDAPPPAEAPAEVPAAATATVAAASAATSPTYWLVDPSLENDPDNILLLDLSNGGRVAIRLKPDWAPGHVERIKTLTRQGFYNGIIFHRVIEGFMAQTGDPTGTGQGGSPLPDLKAEFNRVPHLRGTVSAAREGGNDDSANSQFFIVFYPTMQLDRKYTNFGRVIAGMPYVDQIQRGQPPATPTRILQASLGSQHLAPPVTTPMTGKITADMLSAPLQPQVQPEPGRDPAN